MKNLIVILIALGMTACDGVGESTIDNLSNNINQGSQSGSKIVDDGAYECEVKYEEYEMNAHVIGYTLKDKIQGELGFNLGGIIKSLYAGMDIEKSQMDMTMSLNEVLYENEPITYVSGVGEGKKNDFKGGIDFGLFKIDFSYFKQTPLYTVVSRAVRDALTNTKASFEVQNLPWKSRIIFSDEDDEGREILYMPVGTAAGVQPGDRFYVYNVAHDWVGEPCNSMFLGARPLSFEALAELEALRVEGNVTQLRVVAKNSDEKIRTTAVVYTARTKYQLRNPVRVKSVSAQENLPLGEFGDISLNPYVAESMNVEMWQYGFQPRTTGSIIDL